MHQETDLSTIGVYQIVSPSGKRYVGMTCDSFKSRWYGHLKELRSGTHKCAGLKAAFAKYGEDQLSFEILTAFEANKLTPALAARILALEVTWWESLKQRGYSLYNGRPSGTGSVIHTAETRAKLSAAARQTFENNATASFVWTESGRQWVKTCDWCEVEFTTSKSATKACTRACGSLIQTWGAKDLMPSKDELEELYSSGKTLKQIGEAYNVSLVTIYNLMDKYGIPRRGRRSAYSV